MRWDVGVCRAADGTVKHVAIVQSNLPRLWILTKDGDESVFRHNFPLSPLRLSSDPLIRSHTDEGRGDVEFWGVDRSKVSLRAVKSGLCDD